MSIYPLLLQIENNSRLALVCHFQNNGDAIVPGQQSTSVFLRSVHFVAYLNNLFFQHLSKVYILYIVTNKWCMTKIVLQVFNHKMWCRFRKPDGVTFIEHACDFSLSIFRTSFVLILRIDIQLLTKVFGAFKLSFTVSALMSLAFTPF